MSDLVCVGLYDDQLVSGERAHFVETVSRDDHRSAQSGFDGRAERVAVKSPVLVKGATRRDDDINGLVQSMQISTCERTVKANSIRNSID
jgi:hypothetical protein